MESINNERVCVAHLIIIQIYLVLFLGAFHHIYMILLYKECAESAQQMFWWLPSRGELTRRPTIAADVCEELYYEYLLIELYFMLHKMFISNFR